MDRKQYYEKMGWDKSPFIKTSTLSTPIIEREEELILLEEALGGWDRIITITAPIGYGKTTFMNQLRKKPPKSIKHVISFNTYPEISMMSRSIKSCFPFWKTFLRKDPGRALFGQYLEKMLGSEKMLIIFDEAQDYPADFFKWLRTLNDNCVNLFMIFIGLPGLEDKIASEASLRDRKAKNIDLGILSQNQLELIIKMRMDWVGGTGVSPFTEDGLKRLCESSGFVPRKLIDNGQKLIEKCAKEDIFTIDSIVVEKILGEYSPKIEIVPEKQVISFENSPKKGFIEDLSPTQQDIVNMLKSHESLSIAEISEELEKDIRSIGSLIRKLRGLNRQEVERRPEIPYPVVIQSGKEIRKGRKQYVFSLSDNARRLLSES